MGHHTEAVEFADWAWTLANKQKRERDFVRASRLQGEAALKESRLGVAEERLNYALNRARRMNLVEEDLATAIALAELHRQKREFSAARGLLAQVWKPVERGPYLLFHADALNVLAHIERDESNRDAAIAAATKAYTLAWCDGPPYAYHHGLSNARKHLQELGASEPELPAFDESKFNPLPGVK
jgi:hypothetical protein